MIRLTKNTKVGLALSVVLSAATILVELSPIPGLISNGLIYFAALVFNAGIMAMLVMWYVLVGYKKPHGNMLRMVFFAFSVYLAIQSGLTFMNKPHGVWAPYFLLFAAITVSYISGRLNKIEKNKKLLIFAFFGVFDGGAISFARFYRFFSNVIMLTALSFAYIARYEEHKAAGLEDAN